MSAVKGVNKTLIDAATILAPGLVDGRVKCNVDWYEASTLAAGSTITMGGTIPKGCYVLFQLLAYDALGSATVSVGDAESTARYHSALDVSSAGISLIGLVDGVAYNPDMTTASTPDNQIVLTTASATITGTIKLLTFYVND